MTDSIWQVLRLSWFYTFKSDKVKWFLGSFGSVVSILTVGKSQFKLDLIDSVLLGLAILILVIICFFLFYLFKFGARYVILKYRESKYGNILVALIATNAKINLAKRQALVDDTNFKGILLEVCTDLKDIFEKKNRQSTYSVSFKALKGSPGLNPDPATEVFCICRDDMAAKTRHTERYTSIKHQVFNNSCYLHILVNLTQSSTNKLFYINNDVPSTRSSENGGGAVYMNTSYDVYETLPYKSELVVPIIALKPYHEQTYNLCGFLCVDANKKESFDDKYDLALIQGIADSLYDLFSSYYANKSA